MHLCPLEVESYLLSEIFREQTSSMEHVEPFVVAGRNQYFSFVG